MNETKEDNFEMGESLTANQVAPSSSSMGGGGQESHDQYIDHPTEEDTFDDYDDDVSEDDYSEYEDDDDGEEYGDETGRDKEAPLSLEELLYSASSYHAIIQPVSATMMLAALASVYINTEASREFGAEQFASAYNVWHVDNDGSGNVGKNLLASVGNTFVMVLVIGTMTFGIVLLYKYR